MKVEIGHLDKWVQVGSIAPGQRFRDQNDEEYVATNRCNAWKVLVVRKGDGVVKKLGVGVLVVLLDSNSGAPAKQMRLGELRPGETFLRVNNNIIWVATDEGSEGRRMVVDLKTGVADEWAEMMLVTPFAAKVVPDTENQS